MVAKGPRIRINDEAVADIVNEGVYKKPRGMIGLQIHGVKKDADPSEAAEKLQIIKLMTAGLPRK